MLIRFFLFAHGALFVGASVTSAAALATPVTVDDFFANDTHGWVPFHVDHPPGVDEPWGLEAGLRPLPPEVGVPGMGYMVAGNNHSDDLGMGLKKRLHAAHGLAPLTTYWVDFEIIVASNAASGAFGVGGSPGDGVYLKAGASPTELVPTLEIASDHLRPNVNVGFQSMGGPAATVAGTIANGRDAADPARYVSLLRTHRHRFPVRTDADGALWLIVMTDSAFEGPTTLYYQRIRVTLTPVETGDGEGLVNLSTRGRVAGADEPMIMGFVTTGSQPATYLVRGIGPELARFGVDQPLPDPRVALIGSDQNVLAENDDWSASTNKDDLRAAMTASGAFSLTDPSADAALLANLSGDRYSATIRSADSSAGLALAEIYLVPGTAGDSRLVNLSTRGRAGIGDNALIAGLNLGGTKPERLLIRAVGPRLADFGVINPAVDPVMTLYRGEDILATNQDWGVVNPAPEIVQASNAAGAFALTEGSRDAALLVTLEPGSYTIVVEDGDPGASRTALVEIYRLP